jgi:hypothetical protein
MVVFPVPVVLIVGLFLLPVPEQVDNIGMINNIIKNFIFFYHY